MPNTVHGAADLSELLTYLRATSCTRPEDPPAGHDHLGMCLTTSAAQVADTLLDLIGDVAHHGTDMKVGTVMEHATSLDIVLQLDENQQHVRDAGL